MKIIMLLLILTSCGKEVTLDKIIRKQNSANSSEVRRLNNIIISLRQENKIIVKQCTIAIANNTCKEERDH